MEYDDFDDYEDDWDEGEDYDPAEATSPCIECDEEIFDDVDICPYCGAAQEHGSIHWASGKPLWYIVLAVAGVVAVIVVFA